jgi:hypothetical protein
MSSVHSLLALLGLQRQAVAQGVLLIDSDAYARQRDAYERAIAQWQPTPEQIREMARAQMHAAAPLRDRLALRAPPVRPPDADRTAPDWAPRLTTGKVPR